MALLKEATDRRLFIWVGTSSQMFGARWDFSRTIFVIIRSFHRVTRSWKSKFKMIIKQGRISFFDQIWKYEAEK